MRLSENQVTQLLNEGYSYKDIVIYEQSMMDRLGGAAKAVGGALMNPVGTAVKGAKAIGRGIANNPGIAAAGMIPGVGPAIAGGMAANKLAGNPIGKGIGAAAKTIGRGAKGVAKIGKQAAGAIKNNPGAAIGGALGTASMIPGAGLAGAVAGKALQNRLGEQEGAGLKPYLQHKVAQLYGEGIDENTSYAIVEDFANRHFGDRFLSENIYALDNIMLSEHEMNVVNEHFNTYLVEQGIWSGIKDAASNIGGAIMNPIGTIAGGVRDIANDPRVQQFAQDAGTAAGNVAGKVGNYLKNTAQHVGDTALDYAVPDFIAGPDQVKQGISNAAGAVSDYFDQAGGAAQAGLNAAAMVPGIGGIANAGKMAGKAVKALKKNEAMQPHENYSALRDWTSDMKENLMYEEDDLYEQGAWGGMVGAGRAAAKAGKNVSKVARGAAKAVGGAARSAAGAGAAAGGIGRALGKTAARAAKAAGAGARKMGKAAGGALRQEQGLKRPDPGKRFPGGGGKKDWKKVPSGPRPKPGPRPGPGPKPRPMPGPRPTPPGPGGRTFPRRGGGGGRGGLKPFDPSKIKGKGMKVGGR